jgi:hypothetical protein
MQSGGVAEWGGAIGRTAVEIADRAVALYSDQEHWSRAQMVRFRRSFLHQCGAED